MTAARADLAGEPFAQLDVRDAAAVGALIEGFRGSTVLVNCAGVIRRGEELDPEVFADVVDVNLTGSMRVCAAARPRLKAAGGSIVNTASMLSFFGGGLVPGYAASKGGVAQMTKSLAIACAADGIRVNASRPAGSRRRSPRRCATTHATRADPRPHPAAALGQADELAGAVALPRLATAGLRHRRHRAIDGGYLAV